MCGDPPNIIIGTSLGYSFADFITNTGLIALVSVFVIMVYFYLVFKKDLKVTIQALGWRSGKRYLPLQDDIASVAYWYQSLPTKPFPPLPDRDYLEVI